MIAMVLLLAGVGVTAALSRRGGRAAWVGAVISAAAAWLAGLLESRGLPHVTLLQDWPFVSGPAGQVRFVVLDFEWRVEVLVLSAILMLLLAHAADSTRIEAAANVRILLAGVISLGAILSGSALTLAIFLAVSIGHSHLRSRGEIGRGADWTARGASTIACVVVLILAPSALAQSGSSWPAHAVLLALFSLWMAPRISLASETDPVEPGYLFTTGLLPIAVSLKLVAEAMRVPGVIPAQPWFFAVAAGLALFAFSRSIFRSHAFTSTIAAAVVSLGLLASASDDSSTVLSLSWLAAVVLLSLLATRSLVIRGRWDRLWGAPAVGILILFTSIAAGFILESSATRTLVAMGLAVLAVGVAAIGVVVSRPLFAIPGPRGTDDLLAHSLSRLALALPAVVGIGVGLRGFPEISPGSALLALVTVGLSFVVLATERRGVSTRRRGVRALDWLDPAPIAAGWSRVMEGGGDGVRWLMGLLEGGAGILWAWVILLALLLFQGGRG